MERLDEGEKDKERGALKVAGQAVINVGTALRNILTLLACRGGALEDGRPYAVRNYLDKDYRYRVAGRRPGRAARGYIRVYCVAQEVGRCTNLSNADLPGIRPRGRGGVVSPTRQAPCALSFTRGRWWPRALRAQPHQVYRYFLCESTFCRSFHS